MECYTCHLLSLLLTWYVQVSAVHFVWLLK